MNGNQHTRHGSRSTDTVTHPENGFYVRSACATDPARFCAAAGSATATEANLSPTQSEQDSHAYSLSIRLTCY